MMQEAFRVQVSRSIERHPTPMQAVAIANQRADYSLGSWFEYSRRVVQELRHDADVQCVSRSQFIAESPNRLALLVRA